MFGKFKKSDFLIQENTIFSSFNLMYFLVFLIAILFGGYLLSYAILPFSNGDTAYYVVLGRGILREHALPYSYAFDHKPLGVYLFYGLWDKLVPLTYGTFLCLACLLMAAFVAVCQHFCSFNRWVAWILLVACGAGFSVLDANTETVLVTGEALILSLLYRGATQQKPVLFFLAGVILSYVSNINYLSVVCLFLPCGLILLSPGWFRVKNVALAFVGLCAGLCVLFSPYILEGHGALQTYFSMQREFLHYYSGSWKARLETVLWSTLYTLVLGPILLAWIKAFRPGLQMTHRKALILPLWFVSSLPATVLSGHPFDHYYFLCFAPTCIMLACLLQKPHIFPRYALLPLGIFSVVEMGSHIHKNIKESLYLSRVNYTGISDEIGKNKVLNIRADHTVFYSSDLRPFDIYLFQDHVDIRFGKENAWKRYMQDLFHRPVYVVTPYDGCARQSVEAPVCQWLQTHYTRIYSVNTRHIHQQKYQRFSLDLYKLNPPEPLPSAG